jgi:acetyltransferase
MHPSVLPFLDSFRPPEPVGLRHGRTVHVRDVCPGDGPLLMALVESLSAETRHQRFHGAAPEPLEAALAPVLTMDPNRMVLLAVHQQGPSPQVVGGVQAVLSGHVAALSMVVTDAWQRLGVGHVLLERLLLRLTERSVRLLQGDVLATNRGMLAFCAAHGFRLQRVAVDPRVVRVFRDLRPRRAPLPVPTSGHPVHVP